MLQIKAIVIKLTCLWFISGRIYPILGSERNDLYNAAVYFVHKYFPAECVCFFVDARNHSLMFEKLIQEVSDQKSVYIVSAEDGETHVGVKNKTKPIKPFPCYFILDLPYVGSNMTSLFLRGSYLTGVKNLNESRYLIVAEEHHTYEEASEVLNEMFTYGFLDVDLVNPAESQIDVLTIFPFGRDFKSCPESSAPVMETVAVWKNDSIDEKLAFFPRKLPSGVFSGCSWNISCGYYTPYIIVDVSEVRKNSRFSGAMDGYDAAPLSLLTERLNLTPEWTIDVIDFWIQEHKNGTASGAIPNLLFGRGAQMCCGGLYQSSWALGNMDPTYFHTWATTTWFVAAPDKIPKWIMMFTALGESVWAQVIATSLIVPIIYWVFCILSKNRKSLAEVYLTLSALGFSNSTGSVPINVPLRMVFISWLFYTLHIDQFYLASLIRLITTAEYEPTIKTMGDLLESHLPTGAYFYTGLWLNISAGPDVAKLLQKYSLMTEVLEYHLNQMSLYKNFSIVDNYVFVRYTVSLMNNVSIYPTRVNYIERTMSALMWRHNYLFDRVNWLLLRMFDAGFPVYFLKRTVPDRFWMNPNDNTARAFNLNDLSGAFGILVVGLCLSCLAFMSELIYFNLLRFSGRLM